MQPKTEHHLTILMSFSNYIIATLIFLGALIMLLSATYAKKIFIILPDNKLKNDWKKLRLLMFLFLIGYLVVVMVVIYGKTELLALFSGLIFFMGSLFVFLVVRTGLDSFKKLKKLHTNLDDTELKNKELEQFAYITSHDLKTPLRGISSLATFIKDDLKAGQTDQVDTYLTMLQGQTERLENLINGILHYSKIGKITLELVNLTTIVKDEFKNYQNLNNVTLTIKGKLPVINGDKIQLSQVVSNLVSNALKHNDKEICEVTISSVESPNFHEIIFEDNGPGIPPEYRQKIFEVFQTLKDKDTAENTGIGLSIVKKIIEKHEGTIRITSGEKLGAKFIISYPKKLQR